MIQEDLMGKTAKKKTFLFTFLLFLLCIFTAFAMRTHNYNREAESLAKLMQTQNTPLPPALSFTRKFFPAWHSNFMPYTIECAMMFYYTQEIAKGNTISDARLKAI